MKRSGNNTKEMGLTILDPEKKDSSRTYNLVPHHPPFWGAPRPFIDMPSTFYLVNIYVVDSGIKRR